MLSKNLYSFLWVLFFAFQFSYAVPLVTPETSSSSLERRFSGQATYYYTGLGACEKFNTDNQPIIAMNIRQYKKSVCNKWVRITSNGKSAKGFVMDMCPGCGFGSLDLSPSLFKRLGPLEKGVLPISWSYASKSRRAETTNGTAEAQTEDGDSEYDFDPSMELREEDLLDSEEGGDETD